MNNYIRRKLNDIILKSQWYDEVAFRDCRKFWELKDEKFDVVNLGSSSGVYDFDYSDVEMSCANWALAPQSTTGDFAILKQFRKNLKKNALVIYPFCPFTSISGAVDYVEDRCYSFMDFNLIPNAHYLRWVKIMQMKDNPLAYYPLVRIKQDIKNIILKRKQNVIVMNENQLIKDADEIMNNWKVQFKLTDLSKPFTGRNKKVFDDGIRLCKELVSYCKESCLRLVIVIPPVYRTLADKFLPPDRENLIESFVSSFIDSSVSYYNMMDHELFTDDRSLFRSSYYLNEKGAKFYTSYLLNMLNQR